jgi:hypothetical protein
MPRVALSASCLELHPSGSAFGVSARRLWEHTELGQVNPFGQLINSQPELNLSADFIDVVWFDGPSFELIGRTLADVRENRPLGRGWWPHGNVPETFAVSISVLAFERLVTGHIARCALRRATRIQHLPFLAPATATDAFGVPHVFSALVRRLQVLGKFKADIDQWHKTIENFPQHGVRQEEVESSELMPELMGYEGTGIRPSAMDLADLCDFSSLRFSVIPVINDAVRQLRFSAPPVKAFKKTKRLRRAPVEISRTVIGYDRVLGYRIEQVEYEALWGPDRHWQAITNDGDLIGKGTAHALGATPDAAMAAASAHARIHFPKRMALGRWATYAWNGGEDYREWLITLPFHRQSFFSSHFGIRNVLAHVRCDVRQGPDGERVMLLHEVQSDWSQKARREEPGVVRPPFMKEWPALVMKMMILHAAHMRLDAVAWTRGAHQVFRYKGLGATGLTELYDHTLPREVNRILKPFGTGCEMLGVFVPTNFSIRRSENGYDVYSPANELLGTSLTLEEAREFVPDGGHELLYEVHGVRLAAETRQEILSKGFPAWG